jgi:hypothetical protein
MMFSKNASASEYFADEQMKDTFESAGRATGSCAEPRHGPGGVAAPDFFI